MPAPSQPSFFVSYTAADRRWSEWIAWTLEEAGYVVRLQAWDFRPGSSFPLEMQRAMQECDRTIAILSPSYVAAEFPQPEWAAAFAADPTGRLGKLLPVRVADFRPPGIFAINVYIDLVGLAEEAARTKLLSGVERGRAKPTIKPAYPGSESAHAKSPRPAFPGSDSSEPLAASAASTTAALTPQGSDNESERSHRRPRVGDRAARRRIPLYATVGAALALAAFFITWAVWQHQATQAAKKAYLDMVGAFNRRDSASYFSAFAVPMECYYRDRRVTVRPPDPGQHLPTPGERTLAGRLDVTERDLEVVEAKLSRVVLCDRGAYETLASPTPLKHRKTIVLVKEAGDWKITVEVGEGSASKNCYRSGC